MADPRKEAAEAARRAERAADEARRRARQADDAAKKAPSLTADEKEGGVSTLLSIPLHHTGKLNRGPHEKPVQTHQSPKTTTPCQL